MYQQKSYLCEFKAFDFWFVFSESIFGYKDLRIDVYCTAARMLTYVGVKYSEKITPHKAEGVAVSCFTLQLNLSNCI